MYKLADNHYGKINGPNKHPLYHIWEGMWRRCYNSNRKDYKYYGDRGIRVWEGFKDMHVFIEEMGPRPSTLHSLDKINNDGHYIPGNLRWATKRTQSTNQQLRTQASGYVGVYERKNSPNKWRSWIHKNKKRYDLGVFDCKHDAAEAYNKAARELHGDDAKQNIIIREEWDGSRS